MWCQEPVRVEQYSQGELRSSASSPSALAPLALGCTPFPVVELRKKSPEKTNGNTGKIQNPLEGKIKKFKKKVMFHLWLDQKVPENCTR